MALQNQFERYKFFVSVTIVQSDTGWDNVKSGPSKGIYCLQGGLWDIEKDGKKIKIYKYINKKKKKKKNAMINDFSKLTKHRYAFIQLCSKVSWLGRYCKYSLDKFMRFKLI